MRMKHTQDDNAATIDAIEDQVVASRIAAQSASKVIPRSADSRPMGEQQKPFDNSVNHPIGGGFAPGLDKNVVPDLVEVGAGSRSDAVRHSVGRLLRAGTPCPAATALLYVLG